MAVLRERPVLCGTLYGIGVYLFMNLVVLPLSNAGRGAFVLPVVINGLRIHMFGVGLPAALLAARANRSSPRIHAESAEC